MLKYNMNIAADSLSHSAYMVADSLALLLPTALDELDQQSYGWKHSA